MTLSWNSVKLLRSQPHLQFSSFSYIHCYLLWVQNTLSTKEQQQNLLFSGSRKKSFKPKLFLASLLQVRYEVVTLQAIQLYLCLKKFAVIPSSRTGNFK